MVADAALGRAAAEVVLDAVAGEDLDRPVVHVDREVDGELAARLAQDQAHARVQVRRSAARSNCRWATSQALIAAATCSVVMERRTSVSGGRRAPPRRCGSSPGRPHGAHRSGPDGVARRTVRDSFPSASIARVGRIVARSMVPVGKLVATLPQPSRVPATPAASRRRRARPDRGPPRRRSPARGAARPTRRRGWIETSAGSRPPGARARTSSRNASTSGGHRVEDRRAARSAAAQMSSMTRSRAFAAGPDAIGRLDHAVLDRDDRLDREQRPDGRLGAADPAALLEVLERLEGHVHAHVAAPASRGSRRSRPRTGPRRPSRRPSGRGSPRPSRRPASRRRGSRGPGSMSRAIWALLIVPDSVPATWIETIASAPASKAAS